ncbi:nuclear transport factor 2 family protein [Nocardia sp. NPDC049526]|uniref:nuclear transport factor 2 family protein n=1 Tax=Nocardia sp. NPDC049526 TaxID=3364316 RepID=UPI0037AB59F3
MAVWARTHEEVVEAFAAGWRHPDPHAWDELLADDVDLRQPFLRKGHGRDLWQQEAQRLLTFLPDARSEVLGWAGRTDMVFIEIRIDATLAGRPSSFQAIDRLRIDSTGLVLQRDSFFDPGPVALTVVRRPSAWWPWWRSGLGPLLVRRRFLKELS